MRLSEAILLGALLKPQGFHQYDEAHSCALRAAMEAAGIAPLTFTCWRQEKRHYIDYAALEQRFPILQRKASEPDDLRWADDVGSSEVLHSEILHIIWRLNDTAHWSRERIADWVAEQEQRLGDVGERLSRVPVTHQIAGSIPAVPAMPV